MLENMKKTKNKQLKQKHISKHSLQGDQKKQNTNFRNFELTSEPFFYN